jgi:hypothetical protein
VGNYMMRTNLNIGQSRNIAKTLHLGATKFAGTLLLLNVIAKRGSLASLALLAIIAVAGCDSRRAEAEFCFTVTGEARESDQEAVQQLWSQRECSSDLELEAAASFLREARIERMEDIGVLSYDGETPSGTDTRFGSNWRGDTEICISAEAMDGICPQEARQVIVPVPVPVVSDAGSINTDAGVAEAAPVDPQMIRRIAEARVELQREVDQSQSLISRLRQTGDRAMIGHARRLESSLNAAREALDNDDATLEELRQQEESLGGTKRSANAALTHFREVW